MWWWLACAHRADLDRADELTRRLREVDEAWDERATLGLHAVAHALEAAEAVAPEDPAVAWRSVRLQVERAGAEADPAGRIALLSEARAAGVRCLDADTLWSQVRSEHGWVRAAARLDATRRPCAAFAALAWTRWLAERGPEAFAGDGARIDGLVAAGAVGPGAVAAQRAEALLSGLRADWDGRDVGRTVAALAGRPGPGADQWVRADDLWLVFHATGDLRIQGWCLAWLTDDPPAATAADERARDHMHAMCAPQQTGG
jgi:hypothetical protein